MSAEERIGLQAERLNAPGPEKVAYSVWLLAADTMLPDMLLSR